jgi:hypothetical protein
MQVKLKSGNYISDRVVGYILARRQMGAYSQYDASVWPSTGAVTNAEKFLQDTFKPMLSKLLSTLNVLYSFASFVSAKLRKPLLAVRAL